MGKVLGQSVDGISTYLIGEGHVQHIMLFKDGSEIFVDKAIPFWLLLID